MSSILTIIAQGQHSLFRARESSRAKDILDQTKTLEQRLQEAGVQVQVDEEAQAKLATSIAALEESRRVSSPKATAEERMERAEGRMRQIRQEARLAAASGDRAKLAKLAQEAAKLAREVGKAASEFSLAMSNAAEMGISGVNSTQTAAGTAGETASVAASGGEAIGTGDPAADTAMMANNGVSSADTASAEATSPNAGTDTAASGGDQSDKAPVKSLITDNSQAIARWKEADGFARRAELVLSQIRSVINEAKQANDDEKDLLQKQTRRRMLEEGDSDLATAQDAVKDLRASASPPASQMAEALATALMGAIEGAQTPIVVTVGPPVTPSGVNMLA